MFARLSTDRRLIEWLQNRAAEHLAKLADCNKDNFEPQQARYKEVQALLRLIQTGSEQFSRQGQLQHPDYFPSNQPPFTR